MRGIGALVALLADACKRLLVVLHREDAEAARDTGLELHVLDAARGLGADVVVVRRLAADDGADARDALVLARLRADLRGHRQLEAPGHLDDVPLVAGLLEDPARTLDQFLRELPVEGRRGNRIA